MRKAGILIIGAFLVFLVLSCSSPQSTGSKLREWQQGVWLSSGGAYSIWTDTHYFVVSAAGDSTSAQIYCGSSRVKFTDKGIARHQNLRVRQTPNSSMLVSGDYSMYSESENGGAEEAPLEVDLALFKPGVCNVSDGVIYDSVMEETSGYILMSSCDGDQIKLFSDGRFLYMPSGGGEIWSYRIESW